MQQMQACHMLAGTSIRSRHGIAAESATGCLQQQQQQKEIPRLETSLMVKRAGVALMFTTVGRHPLR
jgi:hypothetical protein